jgi:glycine dehydrogenase subunit 1
MPYIAHTEIDKKIMLDAIGCESIEDLFSEIPVALRHAGLAHVPPRLTELEVTQLLESHATQDKPLQCYVGAGAYEHHIPAAVWEITSRGEFMTAYTPYQAEASQGTLQVIYEYQTMISNLTGMEVSNASMYDGATALAEAVLMAKRQTRKETNRIYVAQTLSPLYLRVLQTFVVEQGVEIVLLPFDAKTGTLVLPTHDASDVFALIIPMPNFFGCIEAVDTLTNWAHAHDTLVIAAVNPTALALFKAPGSWGDTGADMVCGDGQPLGVPLASGGPYFGFLCSRLAFVRQMPGRIVGRTVDLDGKEGFTLTLQAREQHIRRAKAKSNICTNQGLLMTAATIYMALVGEKGLRSIALTCHRNMQSLKQQLIKIGLKPVFSSPSFHEFVLALPVSAKKIIDEGMKAGVLLGYDISSYFPQLGHAILVCVTETKTPSDLERYVAVLQQSIDASA